MLLSSAYGHLDWKGGIWVNSENDASSGGEFLRKVHRVLRDNEQPSDDNSSKPWIYRDYDEFRTAFVAAASVRESFWRDPEPVLRFCDEARLAWPSDQELNDLKLKDPQTHVALVRFREEVLAFEEDPILDVMLQNKSSEPQIIHSAQIVIRNIVQSYCVRSGSMRFSMSLGSRPLRGHSKLHMDNELFPGRWIRGLADSELERIQTAIHCEVGIAWLRRAS